MYSVCCLLGVDESLRCVDCRSIILSVLLNLSFCLIQRLLSSRRFLRKLFLRSGSRFLERRFESGKVTELAESKHVVASFIFNLSSLLLLCLFISLLFSLSLSSFCTMARHGSRGAKRPEKSSSLVWSGSPNGGRHRPLKNALTVKEFAASGAALCDGLCSEEIDAARHSAAEAA